MTKKETVMIIMCVPCAVCEIPPSDAGQTGYQKQQCPSCDELMWTSDKKRKKHQDCKDSLLMCMLCIAKAMHAEGKNIDSFDIIDITKLH